MKTTQVQTNRNRAWRGFNLFELLGFVALIAFVLAGARLVHGNYGGSFSWFLGGAAGFLLFFLAMSALALVADGFAGIPRLPKCRNGCCRGPGMLFGHGDYRLVKFGDEYNRVCRCGIRHKRSGKRFVIINDDATEQPYLIWRPFRGWFSDLR